MAIAKHLIRSQISTSLIKNWSRIKFTYAIPHIYNKNTGTRFI